MESNYMRQKREDRERPEQVAIRKAKRHLQKMEWKAKNPEKVKVSNKIYYLAKRFALPK